MSVKSLIFAIEKVLSGADTYMCILTFGVRHAYL